MSGMVWDAIDQDAIAAVIAAAMKAGVNWFDTAEAYGRGASEKSLAAGLAALGTAPGSVRIATKWWPLFRAAGSIGATIEARIAALSPYPIDLYQVHQPVSLSSIPAQMKEMARLVRAGKVGAVGVSNFSAARMEQAHAALAADGIPLASNQIRFNLLDRSIESNGILEAARGLGVTIIAWSPLAQGLLTGRFHEEPGLVKSLRPGRRLMGGFSAASISRTAPDRGAWRGRPRARHLRGTGRAELDRQLPRQGRRGNPRRLEACPGNRRALRPWMSRYPKRNFRASTRRPAGLPAIDSLQAAVAAAARGRPQSP